MSGTPPLSPPLSATPKTVEELAISHAMRRKSRQSTSPALPPALLAKLTGRGKTPSRDIDPPPLPRGGNATPTKTNKSPAPVDRTQQLADSVASGSFRRVRGSRPVRPLEVVETSASLVASEHSPSVVDFVLHSRPRGSDPLGYLPHTHGHRLHSTRASDSEAHSKRREAEASTRREAEASKRREASSSTVVTMESKTGEGGDHTHTHTHTEDHTYITVKETVEVSPAPGQDPLEGFAKRRDILMSVIREQRVRLELLEQKLEESERAVAAGVKREASLRDKLAHAQQATKDALHRAHHSEQQYELVFSAHKSMRERLHEWADADASTLSSALENLPSADGEHARKAPGDDEPPSTSATWELRSKWLSNKLLHREASLLRREDIVTDRTVLIASLEAAVREGKARIRDEQAKVGKLRASAEAEAASTAVTAEASRQLKARLEARMQRLEDREQEAAAKLESAEVLAAKASKSERVVASRERKATTKEEDLERQLADLRAREARLEADKHASARITATLADLERREEAVAAREADADQWEARKKEVKAMVASTEKELSALMMEMKAKAEELAGLEASATAAASASAAAVADGDVPASLITTVTKMPNGARRRTVHLQLGDVNAFDPDNAYDLTSEVEAATITHDTTAGFSQVVTPVPNARFRALSGDVIQGTRLFVDGEEVESELLKVTADDGRRVWGEDHPSYQDAEQSALEAIESWNAASGLDAAGAGGAVVTVAAAAAAATTTTTTTTTATRTAAAATHHKASPRRKNRRRGR